MKSLHIAFVSCHQSIRRYRKDASFIYRCENLALALTAMGHKVSLLHITALLVRRDFDVVVFLRPIRSWMFDYAVNRLRSRGVMLIGDVDDLIFDSRHAESRPSVMNQHANISKTRNKFVLHSQALERMDKVQFSTKELADRYLGIHPEADCMVLPNAAHRSWYDIAPVAPGSQRCISYFSGTRTHDRDLALVTPVLERLLQRYPDLIMQIVGPVAIGLEHPRIRRLGKVAFKDYSRLVRDSYLCIAPLEDTVFNRGKSALKALEAAAMNVPTVASRVGEYAEIDVNGILLANSLAEWEAQLEFALEPRNYMKLSSGLRERMRATHDIDKFGVQFLEFAAAEPRYGISQTYRDPA